MRFNIIIGICSLLVSSFAIAQEQLSLNQAIEIGLKNNYDISIVQKNVDIAENLNNQGDAGRWPSLQFSLNQNNNANDQIKTASPFQPQGITINSSLTPGLNLNWNLFEGFKVNINKKRYDKLQFQSEGNASIVVSNTIQAIIYGYYLVSLEGERLEVFEKSMGLSRDRYNYVKLKKDYGSAITTDLLLEEGNYLTDSVNYVNQELAYRSALRTLNNLLAIKDLDKAYYMSDSIEASKEDYAMADLESKMMAENVDLNTKYLGQSIVKYDLQIAKSELYPKLSVNASRSSSWGRVDQTNALFFNQTTGELQQLPEDSRVLNTSSLNYGLNFSLTYNLFNGRRINTAIKNAKVREDLGNLEIDKMKLSLRNDLYSNFDSYVIRKKIYGINERKLKSAELNLRITGDKFKLGSINSIDFRVVQLNYLSAALEELNSRYGLLQSKIALMRLTGSILEVYQ
jgi:outer membrane protein TolC